MSEYRIRIHVDPYTRKFSYTYKASDGSEVDAKSFTLKNGDTVLWILDVALTEPTFQIDFGVLNPFRKGHAVSFRGKDGYVFSSPVNFPTKYLFGRLFKYHVFLSNGWRDGASPCLVVPEPPDPGHSFELRVVRGALPPQGTIYIQWVDPNTEAAITLLPASYPAVPRPPDVVVPSNGQPAAMATWTWDPAMPDAQPFTVTLSTQPTVPIPDVEGIVAVSLAQGSTVGFTVNTTASTGAPVSSSGTVQVN